MIFAEKKVASKSLCIILRTRALQDKLIRVRPIKSHLFNDVTATIETKLHESARSRIWTTFGRSECDAIFNHIELVIEVRRRSGICQ
jgi:hypothetical protein